MEMRTRLKEWARTMGYDGPIPETFESICNESTKFVWEQLLHNVRPKQDVEFIKRNIILHRLKERPLEDQGDFLYEIKEIKNYKRKCALGDRINALKETVRNKKYKADQVAQICKMKDISVDYLKKKIEENKQKRYLLEGKKKQLEMQHLQIQETLKDVRSNNITSGSAKGIRESLEHCAEKINSLIKNSHQKLTEEVKQHQKAYSTVKKQKPDLLNHSVAKYLSLQETKDLDEITRICDTQEMDKENMDNNVKERKQTRRALDLPRVVIQECSEKDSFKKSGVRSLSPDNPGEFKSPLWPISKLKSKPKQRESLGLLPNSFLDEVDKSDDNFLCGADYGLARSDRSISLSNDSVFLNDITKIPKNDLFLDKSVSAELNRLLSTNNRALISKVLVQSIQNVVGEFTKEISVKQEPSYRKRLNEDDIFKLELIHVQTELSVSQQKRVLKDLVVKVGRRKLQVLSSIKSKENFHAVQEWLEFNLKEIALDATLSAIKRQLNLRQVQIKEDEEAEVVAKIAKVKNDIESELHVIRQTMGQLENAYKNIEKTKRSVQNQIYQVQLLEFDARWTEPLLKGRISSDEIRTFEDFPLELQRRCTATDPNVFYRDLCADNYPQDGDLDDHDPRLLQVILETPFATPEVILLRIIKAKMKMNLLRTVKLTTNAFVDQYKRKYSYEALRREDDFLVSALERLKSILYSAEADKTLASAEATRQAVQVYLESPLKEFISEDRLVEGQNFRFYQNKLDRFS